MSSCITSITRELVDEIERTYPGLEWLDLSNNRIDRIEGHLQVLKQLKGLDLSYNAVREFEINDLALVSSLEEVNLSRNCVERVRQSQVHVVPPPIRTLDLGYNPISTVDALAGIDCLRKTLASLHLTGTPLASMEGYRNRVAARFPWLATLDGVPLVRTLQKPKEMKDQEQEEPQQQVENITKKELLMLEKAKYALRQERVALQQERNLVTNLLHQLERQQKNQKASLKAVSSQTTTTMPPPPYSAVASKKNVGVETTRETQEETDRQEIRTQETQVSIGNVIETQTVACSSNQSTQTRQEQQLGAYQTSETQTAVLNLANTMTQTDDRFRLEMLEKDNQIATLETVTQQLTNQVDEIELDHTETKRKLSLANERIRQLERDGAALHTENGRLLAQISRKGYDTTARTEALEKLLVAQETAIIDATVGKGKSGDQVDPCALGSLVETWRKKVFEMMVKLEAAQLSARRMNQAAEKERRHLEQELESANLECAKLREDRGDQGKKNRDLQAQVSKLQKELETSNENIYETKKALLSASILMQDRFASSVVFTRLRELEDRIAMSSTRLVQLGKTLKTTRTQNRQQLKYIAQLESNCEEQAALVAKLETEKDRAQRALSAKVQELETVKGLLRNMEQDLIRSKAEETQTLASTIEEVKITEQKRYNDLEMKHIGLQKELHQLQSQHRELERDLLRKQAKLEQEEKSRRDYLEARLAKKETEATNLRKERNALLSTLRDAERRGLLPGFGLTKENSDNNRNKSFPPNENVKHEKPKPPTPPPRPASLRKMTKEDPRSLVQEQQQDESLAEVANRLLQEEEQIDDDDEEEDDDEDELMEMLLMQAVKQRSMCSIFGNFRTTRNSVESEVGWKMVYISGGSIQTQRSWRDGPSYFIDLFWSIVGYLMVFVQTIFSSPQAIDEKRKKQGKKPFFGGSGSGAGGPYPGGGGNGPRRIDGMNNIRNRGRLGALPMGGGG